MRSLLAIAVLLTVCNGFAQESRPAPTDFAPGESRLLGAEGRKAYEVENRSNAHVAASDSLPDVPEPCRLRLPSSTPTAYRCPPSPIARASGRTD